jgi:hypothetical protein
MCESSDIGDTSSGGPVVQARQCVKMATIPIITNRSSAGLPPGIPTAATARIIAPMGATVTTQPTVAIFRLGETGLLRG